MQDALPVYLEKRVVAALQEYSSLLESGVLIVVDENKLQARILLFR